MDSSILSIDLDEEPWERHPTWRWQKVQEYVITHDTTYLIDPWVEEMSYMYALGSNPVEHIKAMAPFHRSAYDAWKLNQKAKLRGGAKWQVEALIMSGASNAELQKRLPLHSGEEGYEMYRKIFFDVDDLLQSQHGVLNTIIATSFGQNSMLSDCDLVWKILGYQLGLEAVDNIISHFAGQQLDENIQLHLYNMCKSRALYYSYAAMTDVRLMYNESYANVLSMARTQFKFTDELARDQEENRISSCVKHLLNSVEYCLHTAERRLPPTEVVDSFSLKVVENKQQAG